ncbi:MAG: maleylpyruvate isomerase N-terminal domain-containing protein, partial [Streptosporangiaceae bacterium]
MTNPTFTEWLTLIEDRSAALRAAVDEAGLTARVPGCPDWSVRDLVSHLGEVQL